MEMAEIKIRKIMMFVYCPREGGKFTPSRMIGLRRCFKCEHNKGREQDTIKCAFSK